MNNNYLNLNNNFNTEYYDFETIEYLLKNNNLVNFKNNNFKNNNFKNNNFKNNKKQFGKITLEASELRSFITKIIFKEPIIYNIILKCVYDFQLEINKINEYREKNNLFKFYVKGNMALLINLLNIGHYKGLNDENIKFDPSDIDTNLFIDISSKEGVHIENISKSLSQRLFYKYRRALESNEEFIEYLSNNVVDIGNNEISELKKKYKIKSIRKIKTEDRLMYKKKDFVSRWKTKFDDNKHNIMISFNETIESFLLYRLFVPYLVEFEDSTKKVINAELIDLSIVRIDPNLSLYNSIESKNKIYDDINTVLKCVKNDNVLPNFTNKYHLEQLLWDKIINDGERYIINITYSDLKINYASLYYLLFEYCLILINDPTDIKNNSKIEKIKLILDIFKNHLKIELKL